jgi:hypothetical protein
VNEGRGEGLHDRKWEPPAPAFRERSSRPHDPVRGQSELTRRGGLRNPRIVASRRPGPSTTTGTEVAKGYARTPANGGPNERAVKRRAEKNGGLERETPSRERGIRVEPSRDDIRCGGERVLRVRRSAMATRRSRREALLTHHAGHTLARDPIVERPKVAKDPWTAGTISSSRLGPLAQLGERLVRNQEVAGSIPARSTKQANRLRGVGSGEESRSVRFRSGLFPRLAHALGALCADGRAAVGASVEKRHSTTPRGRALA